MIEAVMNLLLIILAVVFTGIWIAAVVEFDGKCDEKDCKDCLFPCERNMEGKR